MCRNVGKRERVSSISEGFPSSSGSVPMPVPGALCLCLFLDHALTLCLRLCLESFSSRNVKRSLFSIVVVLVLATEGFNTVLQGAVGNRYPL